MALARPRSPSPLGVLLEGARDVSARAGGVAIDRETFRRAVGPKIAARAEPGRVRGGVLTLHVASSAWAQELTFFSATLVARLREVGLKVDSVRFRVRPSAGQGALPRAERAAPRAALPEDLRRRLAHVEDPALRAAIAEAASLSLGRPALSSRPRAPGPRGAAARNDPRAAGTQRSPAVPRRRP